MAKNEAKSVARAGAVDRFAAGLGPRQRCRVLPRLRGARPDLVPSYSAFGSLGTWQLVINTATTIVTFLLVALLQNSQRRNEVAMHEKLDALADGLADLTEGIAPENARLQADMSSGRPSASSVWD